jgi:proline iminopeptidase
LSAVIEHLGEPRVYLLGHSHGGFVVQKYALAHPDRIAGLILYSTAPESGPDFWAEAMAGLTAYPQRHPDVPEAAAVPLAFQRAVAAPDDDSLSQAFAATIPVYFADFWSRRSDFAPFQAAIRMWKDPAGAQDPAPFNVRAEHGELTMPVVVIAGRQDFICGLRWATLLVEGNAGAKLRVLEKSGHFGHVEQPAEFAHAAAEVLAEQTGHRAAVGRALRDEPSRVERPSPIVDQGNGLRAVAARRPATRPESRHSASARPPLSIGSGWRSTP